MQCNYKSLVKTFGFRELKDTMEKKGWELPSLEEVKHCSHNMEHQECWISDLPQKKEDRETHALLYDKKLNKTFLVNKNNRYHVLIKRSEDAVPIN